MALGDITSIGDGNTKRIEIGAATTSTTAGPSSATDGVSLLSLGLGDVPYEGIAQVISTAGSGTMTATVRLWGYNEISAAAGWTPLPLGVIGTGTELTRGMLNNGVAIGETTAGDTIRYSETVTGLSMYSRIYAQVTAIAGTGTSVTRYLLVRRGL
mgnify:CR=1 FL=1